MSEVDPTAFEAELRRLKPASAPRELALRLSDTRPGSTSCPETHQLGRSTLGASRPGRGAYTEADDLLISPIRIWLRRLRWLGPTAAALGVAVVLLNRRSSPAPVSPRAEPNSSVAMTPVAKPAIRADQIEIDQKLVTAFDAVARLPGGEPVRLHCREWMDEIVMRDSRRGVVIERQAPRLEVIPVRFETY